MKKNIKINIFIFVVLACTFISIFLLNIIGKKVLPVFMNYAVSEMKNISTILINRAISENLSVYNEFENMVIITKNDDNEIQMIDFNPVIVNELLKSTTDSILESLKTIENGSDEIFKDFSVRKYSGGIIYEIPLLRMTDNLFLGNLGPKIPVKLNIVGDVFSNVNTEIKEYGINNALIEVSIKVTVNEKIIIPFISETIEVSSDIPVSLKVIQGNIPIYYGGGISKGSSILSIPTE